MAKISKEEYELLKGLDDRWKWIARDSESVLSDTLWIYEYVPKRESSFWTEDWGGYKEFSYRLFRFVKWEDSEPYSIAELIKEYESEEIKVKKDKKWLVDKWTKERNETDVHDPMYQFASEFIADIKQLDEPEVLSQEWIDDHAKAVAYDGMPDEAEIVYADDLQNLFVPKQGLPVIPQFVAEWIEGNKEFEEKWNDYSKEDAMNDTIHFTIYGLFADYPATNSDVELRKPVIKWLSVDRGNYFKLVNSVRYGYELEEEQKYYALIKGHENIGSDDKYWSYCITDESLDIGDNKVHTDVLAEYMLSATKDEWENLGVNEDNADFVKVEEME